MKWFPNQVFIKCGVRIELKKVELFDKKLIFFARSFVSWTPVNCCKNCRKKIKRKKETTRHLGHDDWFIRSRGTIDLSSRFSVLVVAPARKGESTRRVCTKLLMLLQVRIVISRTPETTKDLWRKRKIYINSSTGNSARNSRLFLWDQVSVKKITEWKPVKEIPISPFNVAESLNFLFIVTFLLTRERKALDTYCAFKGNYKARTVRKIYWGKWVNRIGSHWWLLYFFALSCDQLWAENPVAIRIASLKWSVHQVRRKLAHWRWARTNKTRV